MSIWVSGTVCVGLSKNKQCVFMVKNMLLSDTIETIEYHQTYPLMCFVSLLICMFMYLCGRESVSVSHLFMSVSVFDLLSLMISMFVSLAPS